MDFCIALHQDATEYLRLMRLQKEGKLSVYRKVFQRLGSQ